ncbi:MAG TPA: hypothetical protein VF589_03175 [Allosphingosinicella sp.]|jgi:hypothetical protein
MSHIPNSAMPRAVSTAEAGAERASMHEKAGKFARGNRTAIAAVAIGALAAAAIPFARRRAARAD